MKKYITISLFIFLSVTVSVLTAGLISRDKNSQLIVGLNTSVATTTTNLILSSAELYKHNSGKSCWLLISGKIYDVTTFLNQHPGGASTILPTCGTDATVAYDTKGGTRSHSSSATAMLAAYYIGNLDQTITTSSANQTNPPLANPNAPTIPTRSNNNTFDD